jgi:hypothetical protein
MIFNKIEILVCVYFSSMIGPLKQACTGGERNQRHPVLSSLLSPKSC